MEMNDFNVDDKYMHVGNPGSNKFHVHEEASSSGDGSQELQNTILSRVDLDTACCNEKLVNLHVLLMLLLGWDNGPEAMGSGNNSDFSAQFIEKALAYDLLCGILDSELREVETFLDAVRAEVFDAHHKISSCRTLGAKFHHKMEEKLHDSEESLNKCQQLVLEVKIQSTKLQGLSYFRHENWNNDNAMDISEQYQLSETIGKSKVLTVEQQKQILRMLEKSLARELDLENKLLALRQNEEQLKLKLHYTEQVALRMEEAAEVVWGRFLEAENAAEVLMGISKEQLAKLQIVQFKLDGSIQREAELKKRFEGCIEELNTKDIALKNLERSNAESAAKASEEVLNLRMKVKLLEDQLKESELQLKNAEASNETSQEHLHEMEMVIDSLKENIYEAESRAESSEAKVTELTDANLELTEELNFLKGNNDTNTKKVTSLEKQLREKEIQLQHAKASSEASQEQQNMLYSAIWDMETLIEDLKSKVSKAESKTESVEEQCIVLSESNFELNNELGILRHKIECLETSLEQANNEKVANAKEINYRTKLITDMVTQIATERERIQNQLFSLVKEKAILVKKLQNIAKTDSIAACNYGDDDSEEISVSKIDSITDICTKTLEKADPSATSVQEAEPSRDASLYRTEVGPSNAVINGDNATISTVEAGKKGKTSCLKLLYIWIAVLIALFSALAVYLLKQKLDLLDYF